MKLATTTGLLALALEAAAFPAEMMKKVKEDPKLAARANQILEERQTGTILPMFNEEEQFISTSGGHKFVPPGPDDIRGPCPGLNAFANHGYLPHNGYATIQQFVDAVTQVVGMGPGLAYFLAVYGAVIDGDGTAWSIGGTPPDEYVNLVSQSPVVAKGNGLSGSHNKYESDVSPVRPDLYQYGNDYKVRIEQFQQMFDTQSDAATANYNLEALTPFRSERFDASVNQNPYFFNGPFTGVLVQPAAYTFIYRFMANHTAEMPQGILNQDVLKSWFAITGESGSFSWIPGNERIPDNWYRRAISDPYTNAFFIADAADAIRQYPKFANVGGNTGTTNSFTGVDVNDLSGGIIGGEDLLEGNKFACLAFQFAANAKPDAATGALAKLMDALSPLTDQLACPTLEAIDESQFMQFPGYTRSSEDEGGILGGLLGGG